MSLACKLLRWRAFPPTTKSCCLLKQTMTKKVCVVQLSSTSVHKNQAQEANVEAGTSIVAEVTAQKVDTSSVIRAALEHEDYFGLKQHVTLKQLFQSRVHFGHNCGLRHPSMSPYIFGERQGTDIIDLEQSLPLLQHALDVCAHIVYRGGMVLFLTRNQMILPWVEKMAKDVGEYSHCRRWKQGTFTDASAMFGTLPIYPELCIFFSTQDSIFEMHRGLTESAKLLIPSIAVVDTNCDIENVTYPIPGNDDSPSAMHLYVNLFKEAVTRAKVKRKEDGLDSVVSGNT